MTEVTITQGMLATARARAEALGALRNSITGGDGNLAGYLGELAAALVFNGSRDDTYDYDLRLPDGTTADVKTKRCSSPPKAHYDVSVSGYNTRQRCDRYVFVRLSYDNTTAWVLGSLPKSEFYALATKVSKGDVDPSNGWKAKCDCWNLPISELIPCG